MIHVDLNNSNEVANNNLEHNEVEPVHEPPPKKKRGKTAVYVFMGDVETWEELRLNAKEQGLKFDKTRNETSYFTCYTRDCSYKWKATINGEFKYSIFETTDGL